MWISKTKDGLPLISHYLFYHSSENFEQPACIRNGAGHWGYILFGSKEKDRPCVTLSFLELCLTHNHSNDNDFNDDNIM